MTPERWGELKRIFNVALDLPVEGRATYLEIACKGDADLRREAESLLNEHEQADAQIGGLTSPLRNVNLIGQTIAHYRILSRLGRGGMGVVYKGEDVVLGRAVALKFVAPEISHAADARARFLREAMAAAAVIHPNLNTLLEVEEHQGQLFLVMNFVDGETLRERLAHGPLPLAEALRIAAHTAAGLGALHAKGIVHRDIKASNIMIDRTQGGGRAVITDFGIATVEGQERITRTGGELGTVAYMAPELLAGARPDARSDLWSLGVVLFEMLTGQLPFKAQNQAALAAAIQNSPHIPLATLRHDAPAEVCTLLDRLLAKDPIERVQRAEDAERELCRQYARCQELTTATGRSGGTAEAHQQPRQPIQISVSKTFTFGKLWKYALVLFIIWRVAAHYNARHNPPPPEPLTQAPETSYPGMEDGAVFSPDGRQIAFSMEDYVAKTSSVCIKMRRDDQRVCLDNGGRRSYLPVWSPDGKWISYLRRVDGGTHEIILSSPLGGQERVLSRIHTRESVAHLSRPAWTADSKALIISDLDQQTDQFRLWELSIDSMQRTPLTAPPAGTMGDRSPAVSPDGEWLAFVRESFLTGQIAVMPLKRIQSVNWPKVITPESKYYFDMIWNVGSDEIIFSAGEAMGQGDFRLWRLPFRGLDGQRPDDQPVRIQEAPPGSYAPAISPDGATLLYTSLQIDENIWRIDRDSDSAAWSAPRKFLELSSTRSDAFPSFSADGKRISFVSNRSGEYDLWVSNRDGSNTRQLTNIGSISGTNSWSPDGKWIGFDWNHNGKWDAAVISPEGGQPRVLTSSQYTESSTTWSRDGRYLYISSNRSGQMELWRQPLDGSPAEQVTFNGAWFGFETADGKSIVFSRHKHEGGPVLIKEIGKVEETKLLESVMPLCFFVTPRGIYHFVPKPDRSRRDTLKYYDFNTKKITTIFEGQAPMSASLSVSPDERTILFAQRDEIGSDIMRMDNFR